MAITPRSLRETASEGPLKRFLSKRNVPRTFAADGGGSPVTIPVGSPVSFNETTNLWVPWVQGGANGTSKIKGFAWPDEIVINASGGGEVIGSVMIEGECHYEDIELLASQGTQAQLITALQQGGTADDLRSLGIHVQGLDQII